MNLSAYLAKKKLVKNQAPVYRDMCYQCHRPTKACFCSSIAPFKTNFHFVILMHPMEAKKEHIGTGRLAHLALTNSQIIVDENFDDNKEVQRLLSSKENFPILLYPGDHSINLDKEAVPTSFYKDKTPIIFVIDGTWHCAKSMMRDSTCLHNLPRISFSPLKKSQFKIKQQPADYCLSTIESIYQVVSGLEKQGLENLKDKKEILPKLLEKLVDFQVKCANDPSLTNYHHGRKKKGFSKPNERKTSKKWESRKICFEEKNYNKKSSP